MRPHAGAKVLLSAAALSATATATADSAAPGSPRSSSASSASAAAAGSMKRSEIPSTGRDWVSLSPGLEFQPADGVEADGAALGRALWGERGGGERSPYEMEFVDGTETYYDDYQQAWRLIGFYIDCNAPLFNGNECDGDGNEDEDQNSDDEDYQVPCQRYLMWAAYVDLDYDGGGIGEYQFYDRHNDRWDSSSCIAASGRCARMDCHLEDTNFKLLGFFKEPNYHEWMEQLFKHEGVCIWNNDEYYYMQADRTLWPCQCTNTYVTDEDGNSLYYDTKPQPEGRIGLGLYTDWRCSQDYQGELDAEVVLKDYVSSDYYEQDDSNDYSDGSTVYTLTLEQAIDKWNDAFDAFKVCQPCKAYNLGYNPDVTNGDRQGGSSDEDEDGNYQPFTCNDDADYTNVNQCMKFKTKTEMVPADFRDIMLAHQQGNIVAVEVMGVTYGRGGYRETGGMGDTPPSTGSVVVLVGSIGVLLAGGYMLNGAKKDAKVKTKTSTMEKPLVSKDGVVA